MAQGADFSAASRVSVGYSGELTIPPHPWLFHAVGIYRGSLATIAHYPVLLSFHGTVIICGLRNLSVQDTCYESPLNRRISRFAPASVWGYRFQYWRFPGAGILLTEKPSASDIWCTTGGVRISQTGMRGIEKPPFLKAIAPGSVPKTNKRLPLIPIRWFPSEIRLTDSEKSCDNS